MVVNKHEVKNAKLLAKTSKGTPIEYATKTGDIGDVSSALWRYLPSLYYRNDTLINTPSS